MAKQPAKKAPVKKSSAKKRSVSPKQAAAAKVISDKKVKDATKQVRENREAAERAARDLEVTSAEAWSTPAEQQGTKLLLPSGNVCLAHNPGIQTFIQVGAIPNSLMPLVMQAINTGKGIDPGKAQELAEDEDMLKQILDFADAACVHSVLQPKVLPVPPPEDDRIAGVLYVDRVDPADKMFILQWVVGGTHDLERFREQSADALGVVGAVEDVEPETE